MKTQSYEVKEMTKKMNKIILCSYIILKTNVDITDSIRSGIKTDLSTLSYLK